MNNGADTAIADIALKRFDTVMRYLAYENAAYYTRGQFFLAANGALLAFASNTLTKPHDISAMRLVQIISVFGLALTFLWMRSEKNAKYWIDRWEDICKKFEPDAFGEVKVWRDSRPGQSWCCRRWRSVKSMIAFSRTLVLIAWIVMLLSSLRTHTVRKRTASVDNDGVLA